MGDQPINIFMPTIFWHDRQGILSIDVLQQKQTFAGQNDDYIDVPVYKVATASMQKEIRVWNFHFDPSQQIDQQKKQTAEQQPKAMPTPLLTPKAAEEAANNEENVEEEGVEMMDTELEVLEVIPKKVIMEQIEQQASQTKTKTQLVPEVPMMQQSLSVEFLANLEGHRSTTNVVRFSPDGSFLASGDADGSVLVWKLQSCAEKMELDTPATSNGEKKDEANKQPQQPGKSNGAGTRSMMEPEMDIPANKENWVRVTRASIHHERSGDITGICFSPDSQFIASVSMYETMVVSRADNGKRLWTKSSYRHFANGITWDPRGKYLITLSTDRRMDVLDAQRGTMLRCCYQAELPTTRLPSTNDNTEIVQQTYKLFHDDQLFTFQRGVEFSPCGGVVFAPAAHLEVGTHNVYGAYVFRRADLSLCQPTHLLPTIRPTIQVKCSPVLYQLQEGPNLLGLPHRLIFAVLCRDSLLLYNSQSESPFVFVENLHYDQLTSIAWTPDGRVLVVSSLEGFNSFIRMDARKLGVPCEKQPDFVAMQLEEQQRQQAEAMAQQMQALKTPIKDGESAQPREQTTPQHQAPPPFISLLDSPKLITPRRPRIKKKLNTPQLLLPVPMETDGATENFEPKQPAMEEKTEPEATAAPMAMTTDHQSPKMLVPRKKPRKVAVIPVDVGNGGGEEAAAKN